MAFWYSQHLQFEDESDSTEESTRSLYGSDDSSVAERKIAALRGRLVLEREMFMVKCEHLVDYLDANL